ncbi:histone h1-binding protein [Ophiostoma piceae UAMH 11346]|uniref:Histone h1-binding protein n=1 Tax=Ophiostoma piceae (strain UAMH 11346) TaxID=1262450 RepID=S3C173_OPHP1|nr:histone h1-binding protein [Ophiostoma piceae UAMH 11346]
MADETPIPIEQMVVDIIEPATKADGEPSAEPLAEPPITVASAVPAALLASGVSTPGLASGTITPAMSELPPDQVAYSLKVSLADLCAKAAVLYSQQKNYEEAAEVYARAAEMQAEINGEMAPENAEILFLYGRALFKVGQSKSDVLGGKAPETDGAKGKKKADSKPEKKSDGGIIAGAISAAGSKDSEPSGPTDAKKPLFQFSGDEEWDASDDDDEDAGENGEGEDDEEEDDDLAVAFEVLDLSRVLFEKKLEETKANGEDAATEKEPKGKEPAADTKTITGPLRHILERLADTHDLLAEISLENERYPNAIVDSRASLSYKKQFLPEESELIAEAHFKLSLALEFASVTTSGDEGAEDDAQKQPQQVDQELRDEAVVELEAAITSTKLKLQNKEVELATLHSPEDNDSSRRQIAEVKEIITDMEQRLVDLRKPPIDLNAAVNGPAGAGLGGLLGALSGGAVGGSSADVAEAKKGATDLTGLVRKKAKDAASFPAASPATSESNGAKRKAEEPAAGSDDDTKKVRTEGA